MHKLYLDVTQELNLTSLFIADTEIIPAGTTIFSMPVDVNDEIYQQYADIYDIHFIFEDNLPCPDFYSIPQLDIMARDSNGGFIGTLGQQCDLDSNAPICYINENKKCYLIAATGKEFLDNISNWKARLKPYNDVVLFETKTAAENVLDFIDICEIGTLTK